MALDVYNLIPYEEHLECGESTIKLPSSYLILVARLLSADHAVKFQAVLELPNKARRLRYE